MPTLVDLCVRLLPVYFIVCGITLLGLITLQAVPHHLIPYSEFKYGFEMSSLCGKLYLLFANIFIGGQDLAFFQIIELNTNSMLFTWHIGEGGELKMYQRKAFLSFYFRPRILMGLILRLKSLKNVKTIFKIAKEYILKRENK